MTEFDFIKMHGLGNDYVFIDVTDEVVEAPQLLARRVSDRVEGIGSDGLILFERLHGSECALRMRIFNADGSEAELCGNGIRCLARHAFDSGMVATRAFEIETGAGALAVAVHHEADRFQGVAVEMGRAAVALGDSDVSLPGFDGDHSAIGVRVDLASLLGDHGVRLDREGLDEVVSFVSIGNPHLVLWLRDSESLDAFDLARFGPMLEHHPWFRNRINVHVVHVDSPRLVSMRSWERGSGETSACGTGASAVCVAGFLEHRTEDSVSANLPGGTLHLVYDSLHGTVRMTGPAETVCTGVVRSDGTITSLKDTIA
ncbi:MAG TPA: diaminopimelate epimerase [Phycisphaerales bacterium]|nr:diaminopimelate epimerase [Phycisphaerales bacterium]